MRTISLFSKLIRNVLKFTRSMKSSKILVSLSPLSNQKLQTPSSGALANCWTCRFRLCSLGVINTFYVCACMFTKCIFICNKFLLLSDFLHFVCCGFGNQITRFVYCLFSKNLTSASQLPDIGNTKNKKEVAPSLKVSLFREGRDK